MCDPIDEEWTAADDAVEEVREVRRRIQARFNHDPAKLVEHYMERQKRHGAPDRRSQVKAGGRLR